MESDLRDSTQMLILNRTSFVYKEYTNIVPGDTNGDGTISAIDLLNVQKHSQFIIYEGSSNQAKIEFPYFEMIFS